MQTYKVTLLADRKTASAILVEDGTTDRIKFITWKGEYEIQQDREPGGRHPWGIYRDRVWLCIWHSHWSRFLPDYMFGPPPKVSNELFNPLTQEWVPHKEEIIRFKDINTYLLPIMLEWVIAAPPSPDYKGAEQDKREVEETFLELDREKGVKESPVQK